MESISSGVASETTQSITIGSFTTYTMSSTLGASSGISNEEAEYVVDVVKSWEENINSVTTLQEISLITGEEFSEQPNVTCTTTPDRTTITYAIVANGADQIPDWVTLNQTTGKYEGTAPEVSGTETFSFKIQASWTTNPAGSTEQIVTITVGQKPADPSPVEEVVDAVISTPAAALLTQLAVGATAGLSIMKSIMSGNPPTGLYLIIHLLQIIILLLMIDDFVPEELKLYLESLDYALISFNFIPTVKFPVIKIPANWMEAPQPIEALEALGLESKSTFVNTLSLFATVFMIMVVHFILRFILQ